METERSSARSVWSRSKVLFYSRILLRIIIRGEQATRLSLFPFFDNLWIRIRKKVFSSNRSDTFGKVASRVFFDLQSRSIAIDSSVTQYSTRQFIVTSLCHVAHKDDVKRKGVGVGTHARRSL